MTIRPLALAILLFPAAAAVAQVQSSGTELPIMPLPASATAGTGEFVIDSTLVVSLDGFTEPRLERARQRFLTVLGRETGIPFLPDHSAPAIGIKPRQIAAAEPAPTGKIFKIHTDGPGAPIQQLGEDESYQLKVTPQEVDLSAKTPLGVLHGLQTFLQLVHVTPQGFIAPEVTIDDHPRFPWRGIMIDAGRHFIPLPAIERNLDAMEAVKLNVFHWHLSEDQGFRVESKLFPLLTSKGSDGLFYTQAEVRHIVEYARDRGIRVVPEFDMPCHTTAMLVGYPNLGSKETGSEPYAIERHWGVFDPAMDPTRESTYQWLGLLIGEMSGLFPDLYFHIGGDECDGKEWDRNPRIQQYLRDHNLKDNAALQAMFTARVQKIVAGRHKVMEGWDEVLQPDTPKDVVIQSWRGRESLLDAAKRGYRGLLSNGYYIDLNQPAAEHYAADPLPDGLTPEQASNILGGEATMWSEFVDGEMVDSRIWPRTAAIAERLWSPATVRDAGSMYRRLDGIARKLESYGIQNRAVEEAMLERMTGTTPSEAKEIEPLRVLASAVQPPQGYARGEQRDYTSLTPLNHLVDAVPPESETARIFKEICQRISTGSATAEDWKQAHDWLLLWRDNDHKLQPLLGRSDLTQELAPVSRSLNQAAQAGLDALDALRQGQPVASDAQQQALKMLAPIEKPQASLILVVVPSIEMLVKAVKVNQPA